MLPRVQRIRKHEKAHGLGSYTRREILHIRHHSLFAPRDFDLSPYFKIVKPTVEHGFDYKALEWGTLTYETAETDEDDKKIIEPAPESEKVHIKKAALMQMTAASKAKDNKGGKPKKKKQAD